MQSPTWMSVTRRVVSGPSPGASSVPNKFFPWRRAHRYSRNSTSLTAMANDRTEASTTVSSLVLSCGVSDEEAPAAASDALLACHVSCSLQQQKQNKTKTRQNKTTAQSAAVSNRSHLTIRHVLLVIRVLKDAFFDHTVNVIQSTGMENSTAERRTNMCV